MRLVFAVLVLIISLGAAIPAWAVCGSCSAPGKIEYDESADTYIYCNGSNWISMEGTVSTACTRQGEIEFSSNAYHFCDGANWFTMDAGGTLTACSVAGQREYDTSGNIVKWCNGSNWVDTTSTGAATIGEICTDGTVYAGEFSGIKLYVPPADNSSGVPWNNGTSNWTLTGATSTTDGTANTATLDVLADAGAPYQAAELCANLSAHGHTDWYLPAKDQLNVLYTNRVAIGGFDTSGSWPSSYYVSSTESANDGVWGHAFDGTGASAGSKVNALPIRCVRNDDPCAGSPSPGDTCADGSVYAGLSPDGNVPMYVTRCDAGLTWGGSSCTGSQSWIPWNNANFSGVTTTNVTSTTDGDGNTATLITLDADSNTGGVQPHQAAQFCADLVESGYDDWYLPAKDELNVLCTNKTAIGGFINGEYLSSTEASGAYPWTQFESNCSQANFSDKGYGYPVRCVRK